MKKKKEVKKLPSKKEVMKEIERDFAEPTEEDLLNEEEMAEQIMAEKEEHND